MYVCMYACMYVCTYVLSMHVHVCMYRNVKVEVVVGGRRSKQTITLQRNNACKCAKMYIS